MLRSELSAPPPALSKLLSQHYSLHPYGTETAMTWDSRPEGRHSIRAPAHNHAPIIFQKALEDVEHLQASTHKYDS